MHGFYVFGGGMGHLARVRKFIDLRKIRDFRIITGNPLALRYFPQERLLFFTSNGKSVRDQLISFLESEVKPLSFENFYVDCFPGGILNELSDRYLNSDQTIWLSRRLKDDSYNLSSVKVKYDLCLEFERPAKEQQLFCQQRGIRTAAVNLPVSLPDPVRVKHLKSSLPSAFWLIIHSSSKNEIDLLRMKADLLLVSANKKISLILITDQDYQGDNDLMVIRNEMRPVDYFPLAEKIFSGAGFNMIQELRDYREKHICIPFERKYDDQKWRIKTMSGD